MLLQHELLILIAMIGTILAVNLLLKLPTSVAMALAAVVGALVGGEGIPIRHLFEGTFAFLDTALIISSAMVFMFIVQRSGAFEAIGASLVKRFHKRPLLLLILLMLVMMFPGMVTGTASIAVLCAGAIVAPILSLMGFSTARTGAFIAIGATLGMAAPPVNIPSMLIASSVDMTYLGFTGPLLLISMAVALFATLYLGLGRCKAIDLHEAKKAIDFEVGNKYGWKIYLPIIVLVCIVLGIRVFPRIVPDIGLPFTFVISSIVAAFTGKKCNILETASDAMRENVSVLGKIMAIGMFLQIFNLVGVRGYIVANCFGLPTMLLFVAIVFLMPVFGGISVYGSASLFGPPLLLALLGGDEIVIAASLSVLAILGELIPPTALAANYASRIVGETYPSMARHFIVPLLFAILVSFLCLTFSSSLSFLTV